MIVMLSFIGGVLIAKALNDIDWLTTAFLGITMAPLAYAAVVPLHRIRGWVSIVGGVVFVFVVAFGFGNIQARAQLLSRSGLNKLVLGEKGKNDASVIEVRILRTGERGVLFFDPQSGDFGFLPWENVRRIDWPLTSVFQR